MERNPTANPIAAVTISPQVFQAVSATARPVRKQSRGTGRERSRSTNPCCRSSAAPVAAFIPVNRTPVVINPGTRKSTYGMPPAMGMAPPKTYRKISRNIAPWMVPRTMSCGVRR
jgi:hypothetical protein